MERNPAADPVVYEATESFTCTINGEDFKVIAGVTHVPEGHPLMEGRESQFRSLGVHYRVEQATAAPGETRAGGN